MTPVLMVSMLLTNDFLSMSLTTDRASLAPRPSVWRMQRITAAAVLLGACKLGFSTAMLGVGLWGRLGTEELQTLTFVTLVLGNQALLYVARRLRWMWPSSWRWRCPVPGWRPWRGLSCSSWRPLRSRLRSSWIK
jgi:H+-transporting ATPase